MQIDFTGKRVMVTGAGKGIGRSLCTYLAGLNATVVAVSRTRDDLVSLNEEIGCETIVADLSNAAEAKAAAEQAGEIHCLINNAGISIPQPLMETTVEALDQTLAINVRAVLVITQVIAQGMIARGNGGSIVNLSSQASMRALKDHAAYCASKGALDQLTRVMALELGPYGIRVNAVNPTVTLTPMGEMAWGDPAKSGPMLARIPLGKFAQPEDVARAAAYLASDQSDMVHGTMLAVDGGFLSA